MSRNKFLIYRKGDNYYLRDFKGHCKYRCPDIREANRIKEIIEINNALHEKGRGILSAVQLDDAEQLGLFRELG